MGSDDTKRVYQILKARLNLDGGPRMTVTERPGFDGVFVVEYTHEGVEVTGHFDLSVCDLNRKEYASAFAYRLVTEWATARLLKPQPWA